MLNPQQQTGFPRAVQALCSAAARERCAQRDQEDGEPASWQALVLGAPAGGPVPAPWPGRTRPGHRIRRRDKRGAYTGFTPGRLQERVGRDDEDWPDSPFLLIADEQALASAEFPLLAVNNLPDEDDAPFRITLAAAGFFIVSLGSGAAGPGA
nr:hypothetical protein StreXyl84_63220 [Streptomyces sp. Xyl84]